MKLAQNGGNFVGNGEKSLEKLSNKLELFDFINSERNSFVGVASVKIVSLFVSVFSVLFFSVVFFVVGE